MLASKAAAMARGDWAAWLQASSDLPIIAALHDVFHALAAPARRALLDELHARDGQTLFELCTRLTVKHGLDLSRQAISQHLDVLESAGVVSSKREGRYKFHYLDATPLRSIAERWVIKDRRGG
jgi:DNA-binding transcriptional ArsR family regulator